MSTEQTVVTLVEIDRRIWAGVKHYATLKSLKTNEALDLLLGEGLKKHRLEMG